MIGFHATNIGQRQPVEVTYLVYEGTLQAEALALVAAKMRSALMIDGELPEDGLAALDGGGQDMFLALARRLAQQGTGETESLEALFAESHERQIVDEDYLVDPDWDGQITPATVDSTHGDSIAADALWEEVFDQRLSGGITAPAQPVPAGARRCMSFEELARSIRRPVARRRLIPSSQLALQGG